MHPNADNLNPTTDSIESQQDIEDVSSNSLKQAVDEFERSMGASGRLTETVENGIIAIKIYNSVKPVHVLNELERPGFLITRIKASTEDLGGYVTSLKELFTVVTSLSDSELPLAQKQILTIAIDGAFIFFAKLSHLDDNMYAKEPFKTFRITKGS